MGLCGPSHTLDVNGFNLAGRDMTKLKLYGNDHSPWVQAIMLGLHEKGMEYTRSTFPPLEVFKKWGPMMPAASIDDGGGQGAGLASHESGRLRARSEERASVVSRCDRSDRAAAKADPRRC